MYACCVSTFYLYFFQEILKMIADMVAHTFDSIYLAGLVWEMEVRGWRHETLSATKRVNHSRLVAWLKS
jgi:hypothetical protein